MFRGMYRGSGQGGGGSVDYSRVVEKIAVIPSAETATVGKVYMYMGESNATYTHGYIYECVATQTATAVSFSGNIVSSWAVADFVSYLQEGGSAYNEVTHGTLTYDASGGLWDLVGYDANGLVVMSFHEYTEDLEDFGCVFASSTHQDGDSCQFTMTTSQSGKKWKRLDVQPGGEGGGTSGDQHNLGWYATQLALETAHPTAEAGDWAIVGATDTVWIWDTDNNEWVDSDQKGQVTSVNNQTGAVTLTASDVGAATAEQGAKADTAVQPADLATVATTGQYSDLSGKPTIPEATQVSTMPQASADELGKIYQFVGTTDANYTNGYFYKCVSDGQDPATYSWTAVEVQAGGWLPTQTGNAGKFLTTDGTDASWGTTVSDTLSAIDTTATETDKVMLTLGIGTQIGYRFNIYASRFAASASLAIGSDKVITLYQYSVRPFSNNTIDLGSNNNKWKNVYTAKINNGADITVPAVAGSMSVQVSSMPTADSTLEGQIYQFVGATDSTYTNGHFYKCVSDGQTPATYSWTEVSMGGSSLPDPTGKSGRYLTNDGTNISWSAKAPLVNNATSSQTIAIGNGSSANTYGVSLGDTAVAGTESIAIGFLAKCNAQNGVSIGEGTNVTARYGIQLGGINSVNNEQATLKVGFGLNDNYKLLDSDGTIPTARLTKVNSTITLTAAGWSSNSQTVNVTGMTADGVVMVSPDPTDQSAYTSAGILCTAQAAGSLTFTCDTVPSGDLSVNVVML